MERGRGPRVDASAAVQGLARLTGAVVDGGGEVPGIDPNLGQGAMQGLQQAGAGLQNVGQALFDINERVAEAKARSDIYEHQIALDVEAANFERWRTTEGKADPTLWESELRNRLTSFAGNYTQGKNLSPIALDAIDQQSRVYIERRAIATIGEADRELVGRATSAMKAQAIRAREAGNLDEVARIADEGVKAGYWWEDQAEMMKLQAQDEIEQKSISDLKNWVQSDINEGRYGTAKERVRTAPLIPEPERAAWVTGIEKEERQGGFIEEVKQIGYVNPSAAIKALDEVDESGQWKNWRGMSEEARFKTKQEFRGLQADIWQGDAEVLSSRIVKEGMTEEEVMQDEKFKGFPDYLKDATLSRIRKGALDDFMELSDFHAKAGDLDTRSEDGRIKASQMIAEAKLRFRGDALESAVATVQKAIDEPKPLMPDKEAITMARSGIRERFENEEFGRFRFAKSEIREEKLKDGSGTAYFVNDPSPPEGFGYQMEYKRFHGLLKTKGDTLRRINLSPDEVKRLKEAKDDDKFTDQIFYQAAGRKFIDAVETVERKKEAGEYDSAVDYQSELGSIMGISKQEAFERRESAAPVMRGDLEIPSGEGLDKDAALWPSALRGDPRDRLNQLKNATGY
jgi:hypothetical protein